jgi:hypothetical protein
LSLSVAAAEATKEKTLKRLFNISRFQHQYPGFLETRGLAIANEVVIAPMHAKMKAAKYSQKIIDSTRVKDFQIFGNGVMEFTIVSDYETEDGAEVAKFREEGTKRWWNKPVKKLALSWIAAAVRAFSKGHWMPARPGTHIVKNTIAEKAQMAQDRLDKETDDLLTKMLKS